MDLTRIAISQYYVQPATTAPLAIIRFPNPLTPGSDIQTHVSWGTRLLTECSVAVQAVQAVYGAVLPQSLMLFVLLKSGFQHKKFISQIQQQQVPKLRKRERSVFVNNFIQKIKLSEIFFYDISGQVRTHW